MSYLLFGRPNAGKSSIFNLLTTNNSNIIHQDEGTTRDWHKQLISNTKSYLFDMPGIVIHKNNKFSFNQHFNQIIENEIKTFIYVIEYKNGFNEIDKFNINNLRKFDKKIILAINKFDNFNIKPNNEFTKYGINSIIFLSCSHNFGLDTLKKSLDISLNEINISDNDLEIAIFGKPNAGKSTFLNTLLGYQRSTISPVANTTTDFVIDYLNYKNKLIKIIDTAGIGKKSNIKNNSVNFYSIKKTFENIFTVDCAMVLIDSIENLDRQDKRIIKLISEKSKSIILIFNKIDLIEDKNTFKTETILDIENQLSEIKNIKIFFITALKNDNTFKVLDYIFDHFFNKNSKISTSKLNIWLKNVVIQSQHPLIENKKVNFKYAVQVKSRPVTIKIFCSYSNKLKSTYKRYLSNNFNKHFNILNQKTRFIYSSSKNPYI